MAKNKDTNNTDDTLKTLDGLLSIQTERRKHDAQTKDQTVDADDILDKRK